jgi:hypothetical protein
MPSSARRLDLHALRAACVTEAGEVVPVAPLIAGTLAWRWEHAHAVVHAWRRWSGASQDVVSTAARLLRPPGGSPVVAIDVALAGRPEPAAAALDELRRLEPEADTVGIHRPAALRPPIDPVPAGGARFALHRRLVSLPRDAVDAFLAATGPASGSPLLSAELRRLGGGYALTAIGAAADPEEAERVRIGLAQLERRLARWL